MIESILISIRKQVGLEENCEDFDSDLIMYINSAFMDLKQLGVGPNDGYVIQDVSEVWEDFINTDENPELKTLLSAVKTFIYLKVRLTFDPPQGAAVLEHMNKMLNETEWRINLEAETNK